MPHIDRRSMIECCHAWLLIVARFIRIQFQSRIIHFHHIENVKWKCTLKSKTPFLLFYLKWQNGHWKFNGIFYESCRCLVLRAKLLHKKHLECEWFIHSSYVEVCAFYVTDRTNTLSHVLLLYIELEEIQKISPTTIWLVTILRSLSLFMLLSLCLLFSIKHPYDWINRRNPHPFDSAKSAGRSSEHSTVEYVSQTEIDDASHRRKILLVTRVMA